MFFKKKYTFVPPCPRCGSTKTGYVIRCMTEKECNERMYRALLNGELLEAEIGFDFGDIDNNLFCKNCGSRWYGDTEIQKLSIDEIYEQKELRGINENLIDDYEQVYSSSFAKRRAIKSLKREQERLEKKQIKAAQKTTAKPKKKKVKIKE